LWLWRFPTRGAENLMQATSQILADLEQENARLQRLVAELLTRNQQLRQALEFANPPRRSVSAMR
jgi:exonuclease VII large subunit